MAQSKTLRCRGLYTFANSLSEIPDGALIEAKNVVIDRDSVLEPRRGYKTFGSPIENTASPLRAKQLTLYKGRVFRHYSTTLQYDSDAAGDFQTLSADITEVQSGLRIKAVEANGNFYFTTSKGIKKVSAQVASDLASVSVTDAGGIKALDLTTTLDFNTPGFFSQDSTVAYRIVWGIKDANQNLILGVPSSRTVIDNPIMPLVLRDYNDLLNRIDIAALNNGGGTLSETDYLSTLKLSINSTSANLYTALTDLCTKLDADIGTSTYHGRTGNISAISVANPTQITSTAHGLLSGETVTITGSDSIPTIDGNHTVTVIDADNFTIPISVTTFGSTGSWKQTSIASSHPAPSLNPTSQELVNLQQFYDDIVGALLTEDIAHITAAAQLAANFQSSRQSCIVNLKFSIPQNVTTAYFYQVYRSPLTTSSGVARLGDLDPGDDLQLVFETNPTAGDLVNGYIAMSDITPESFLGANLYTNINSGEGILQANEIPPLSHDIALFRGTVFYSNTQTKHQKQIALLGTSGLASHSFIIDGTAYAFTAKVKQVTDITCVAGASLTAVGPADYFDIYSADSVTHYRFWFDIGTATAPSGVGVTLIAIPATALDTNAVVAASVANAITQNVDFVVTSALNVVTVQNEFSGYTTAPTEHVANVGFTVAVTTTGTGEDAATKQIGVSDAATPAQQVDETARSIIRVVNEQVSEVVYGFYLSGPNDVPGLMLFERRALGGSSVVFTVGSSLISDKFSPQIPTSGTAVETDNQVFPNRIYYSKFQQAEAVPSLDYFDVGPKDQKILRIIPLRDSLFVFTERAVYRVAGDNPSFVVSLFDSSTNILAPDTAAILNNRIYVFSSQGIVTVSETGVQVVSRPIENLLLPLIAQPNFATASWGVSYESDRAYLVFTTTKSSDTFATQCFRFNTFTNTWTQLLLTKTCGIVSTTTDRLYLGATDVPFVEEERKNFNRMDYCDRETVITMRENSIVGNDISLGALFGVESGDVLIQTQLLTISQFNRLLQAIDSDTGLVQKDYYATLKAIPGPALSLNITALCAKLNSDPGIVNPTFSSSGSEVFTSLQTDFNGIVDMLNADPGANRSNYKHSTGNVLIEAKVESTNPVSKVFTITLPSAFPVLPGPMTLYKHISSLATWAPQHFGDPSMLKHFREGTLMFQTQDFTRAIASYSSDLSPGFVDIAFSGEGTGEWGGFTWGGMTWGGDGTSRPLRTLIPREKQRCRFINCRFKHAQAFEKYSIFGVSLTAEINSTEAYK